jgi:hypothetical protein
VDLEHRRRRRLQAYGDGVETEEDAAAHRRPRLVIASGITRW